MRFPNEVLIRVSHRNHADVVTRDSFTCTKIGLDTRLSKHNSPVALQFWGGSQFISLSLSLSNNFRSLCRYCENRRNFTSRSFSAAAVAVAVSALLSTSETAIALNLPFYRLTHFWRRNAANLLRLRSVVQHVRSAVELAGTSPMFTFAHALRCRVCRRVIIITFSLLSLLLPLLLSSFVLLCLLPIVIAVAVAVHC